MSDQQYIARLYESIQARDFFTNEEMFDWGLFLEHNIQNTDLNYLSISPEKTIHLESFERIKADSPTRDGFEDVYEIILFNGSKFYIHINYLDHKKFRQYVNQKITHAEHKKDNNLADLYRANFNSLSAQDLVCMVFFKDADNNLHLTNKVQYSAKELFVSLKHAILDSWTQHSASRIKALMMRINNQEIKRLKFYKMLMEKFLTNFPNIFEDALTEKVDGNTILIASK